MRSLRKVGLGPWDPGTLGFWEVGGWEDGWVAGCWEDGDSDLAPGLWEPGVGS